MKAVLISTTFLHLCRIYMYMNYLRRNIFLLLVALLRTYLITNVISKLEIVIYISLKMRGDK